jgi:hypothetical protein
VVHQWRARIGSDRRGSYLLGGLGLALGLLTAGLWLQWAFVRWPLIIYTLIIGLCGLFLLVVRPFELRTSLQAFGFLYFAYLVFRWHPYREPPIASDAGAPISGSTDGV